MEINMSELKIIKTDEPIQNYEQVDNFIIVPITLHTRKDGGLVFSHEIAKMFDKNYNLSKKWGYLVNSGINYPVYRHDNTNLIGIPVQKHYKSAFDKTIFTEGLFYLSEFASGYKDYLFYITGLDDHLDVIRDILKIEQNIIYLQKVEEIKNEEM
jgi:hypothetical protein